ncbi:hypothetical protein EZS27_034929 [termite gut metagenome]|uniref:IS1 family transposase n=1 Tax=termite gut metagenome TaxID=433724 RepID=A0A5J4PY44_9ZZZZ
MRFIPIQVQKNYCWIWIAIDRDRKKFLNFVIGDRSNQTALKFWNAICYHCMNAIASDYWKPYECIIPKEKHVQTKAQTFTVEGYNSLLRHFLQG